MFYFYNNKYVGLLNVFTLLFGCQSSISIFLHIYLLTYTYKCVVPEFQFKILITEILKASYKLQPQQTSVIISGIIV